MMLRPPRVDEIKDPLFSDRNLRISIMRLDLGHPTLSGNKGYKLKYNIEAFRKSGKQGILSFGGAFSNHIAALAAAGEFLKIPTIGIIRGEEDSVNNPTLKLAASQGMKLHFADRELYRDKERLNEWVKKNFREEFYVVPEGGSNELGLKGCKEILDHLDFIPDKICCAMGTGTTVAGLASSEKGRSKVLGFPVLKGDFFRNELIRLAGSEIASEIEICPDYHFGGYAKITAELKDFADSFYVKHSIPLDYIYTAKMMFGIHDLASKGYFTSGSHILAIHTGGLQGNAGFDFT